MFINPSSPPLNPTVFPSGTILGNTPSARVYPLPDLLPLSTICVPAPGPSSTLPSSRIPFSPSPQLPPLSELSATTSLPGAVGYPYSSNLLGVIDLLAQSSPSVSFSSDSWGPTMDTNTNAGMSLPPFSTFNSDSDVSASLTFGFTASRMMLTSSPAISSSPSISRTISTNSPSMSESTSTPTPSSTPPSSTASTTSTFVSPTFVSSYHSSYSTSLPSPSSPVSTLLTPPSTPVTTSSLPPAPDTTLVSVTVTTLVSPFSSSDLKSPSTSTHTITSVLSGQEGTITDFITSSVVLSTQPPGGVSTGSARLPPGAIAAIVLGIVGAIAFSVLWFFCARRRHRRLAQEATLFPSEIHAPGPLNDEVHDGDEPGYGIGGTYNSQNSRSRAGPVVEERYAGILAALHSLDRFGRGNEGGSTGGVYGSHHDSIADMGGDDDVVQASFPTVPLHTIPPEDPPYVVPLSPPPLVLPPSYHQTPQAAPPPSAYYMTSHRRGSPGPDAAGWLGGHSVAPSYSSHYARSQTLGSGTGSGSGSVDALTRTRNGSEEPLLGVGKAAPDLSTGVTTSGGVSLTIATDLGGNRTDLGSAFGSPADSIYSRSAVYSGFQHDTSGSYDAQTASGSGSYGYARSGTPSSFDVLRSVSSQGALSSVNSHGHSQGIRFGFSRPGSSSSSSIEKKANVSRPSFGVPPTSFKPRKDWGSVTSHKAKQGEKQSTREKHWRRKSSGSISVSGSVEKQERASPVMGVRALLDRLRRTGHTPSPRSSNNDLPSLKHTSMDVDPEKAAAVPVTPPPIQVQAATPRRRRFSFILSNPDPHPPSPYSGVGVAISSAGSPYQRPRPVPPEALTSDLDGPEPVFFEAGGVQPTILPAGYALVPAPSPVPTEESQVAEGLLHPRLQTQGYSGASLRDFEDYSRPIDGVVKNQLYSTTTFGTQDDADMKSPSGDTPIKDAVSVPGDGGEHENEMVDVFGMPARTGVPSGSRFAVGHATSATTRHSPGKGDMRM